jgi:fructoselysine 6-kinase
MTRTALATIGDNCIDRYLPFGRSAVGGNAVNVAVHLVRLGWDCAYFGAVGADPDGDRTRDILAGNGVDLAHLVVLPGRTSYTNLDVDADGDRIIAYEDFGVCADYRPSEADIAALHGKAHVHIGWLKDARALRARLAGSGVTVSQDVAVNAEDGGLDVAFGSAGASMEGAKLALRQLLDAGNRIAVVTCGALGSIASDGGEIVTAGIRPVEVVDTTGAGDTFIAGFLGAWLRKEPLAACLDAGSVAAAETCRHVGGFPQACEPL